MPIGNAKLLSAMLTVVACLGQEPSACDRRISDLEKHVKQLGVEMITQRLQFQEFRITAIESRVASAAAATSQSRNEEELTRADLLSVEIQLANALLDEAEKVELQKLRNQLLDDEQARLRREHTDRLNREAALREELDRERAVADELRRRLTRETAHEPSEPNLRR